MTYQIHTYDPIDGWNWCDRKTHHSLPQAKEIFDQVVNDGKAKNVVVLNRNLKIMYQSGKVPTPL